jgi:hypothetical protein
MGSYCGISFDRLSVFDARSYVPDDWASLFQESDRRTEMRRYDEDDEDEEPALFVEYVASRPTILRRLALLGYTEEAAKIAFNLWLEGERETWNYYVKEWKCGPEDSTAAIATGLGRMDWESWKEHAQAALATRFDFDKRDDEKDPLTSKFYDLDDSYLYIDGYGSLMSLRVLLDACPKVKQVRLDVSDVISSGYYQEDSRVIEDARNNAPHQLDPLAPTVILGEGSTDLLVLRLALEALHPELVDYFSFFNHSELSVDGGANYLVKFLKAFAAARATSRMLAIFDNDAAGVQAFEAARRLKLPPNIMVTRLPDSEIARAYPTIGPSGAVIMDVNGQAAGIELYLGRRSLSKKGKLLPVRWGGYIQAAGKYQGEVEDKAAVLEAFTRRVTSLKRRATIQREFADLALVWQHIFDVVEHQAGRAYLRAAERSRDDW